MQVQVETVDPVTRRLKVTLPKERVKIELEAVYRNLQKNVTVKGYRKGKAPRPVLEKIYKPRVESDVIQQLVQESYSQALEEQKLNPVASPVINETRLKEGEDFTYTATVEVKPAFDLPEYKGFSVSVPAKPVDDKDVEEQLKLLAERKSQLVPMLEDRALAVGDFAVVDYETFIGGSATRESKTEDATIEVGGGQLVDDMEKALPGMRVGENRSVDVVFPEDHADPKLAGKKVLYRVTLKEIKKRELPEVNEDFAKEAGAEGIDDLKSKIRTELGQYREDERKKEIRTKLMDKILEKVSMDVPPAMLDRQLRALYQSAQQVLGQSGRVLDRKSFDTLKSGLKEQAERRVKELLVLEQISRQENIQVAEEDLNVHFERIGTRYGQSPAAVRAYYMQEGRINALVNVLAEEKALDFLEKQSTITG